MKNQPIGFLDSGVGGLTVVKEVMKQLPHEQLLYIGDSARNPYGPRPMEEVRKFTHQLANFLVGKGIKLLVVACNTATVAALETLKKELPVPVIGVIESGSQVAIEETKNHKIGVIGTLGTIQSKEYEKQILKRDQETEVYSIACPRFVSIVEKDQFENKRAEEIVHEELGGFKNTAIDTLVLGCTHYPLLQPIIQDFFGHQVTLVDPGVETTKKIEDYLNKHDLANPNQDVNKEHLLFTTGSVENFTDIARNWLDEKHLKIAHVPLEELNRNDK